MGKALVALMIFLAGCATGLGFYYLARDTSLDGWGMFVGLLCVVAGGLVAADLVDTWTLKSRLGEWGKRVRD